MDTWLESAGLNGCSVLSGKQMLDNMHAKSPGCHSVYNLAWQNALQVHVPYHIHTNKSQEYVDSHVVHTSQLFFGDALYEQISLQDPYCHSETNDSTDLSSRPHCSAEHCTIKHTAD